MDNLSENWQTDDGATGMARINKYDMVVRTGIVAVATPKKKGIIPKKTGAGVPQSHTPVFAATNPSPRPADTDSGGRFAATGGKTSVQQRGCAKFAGHADGGGRFAVKSPNA